VIVATRIPQPILAQPTAMVIKPVATPLGSGAREIAANDRSAFSKVLPRRIDMIGNEGAPFTDVIGARRQHEVVDSKLATTPEQVCKRAFAFRTFERIGLLDFDPGLPATFGAKLIELASYGFLLKNECLAGGKPFLPAGIRSLAETDCSLP
jgi:hypothetical protein